MPGALDGYRVLDLSQGIAGPYAAMLLGDQGADVIKLEPPARDRLHQTPGYHVVNRGKQIHTADLTSDQGRALLERLLDEADFAIVDLPEREARRRGLDYGALGAGHPALVYLAMPPYGTRGPL